MNQSLKPILSRTDFQKLSALVNTVKTETAELLENELSRSVTVVDEEMPDDVVAMNSKVSFVDQESGKESVITLVYPHEANIGEGKISILTPVGSALIGLKVGQIIEWPFPNGKSKELKVVAVTREAASG